MYIHLKNGDKIVFYIYRKRDNKFILVDGKKFETVSEAYKYKKKHLLSGVSVSKLDPEEYNYRHRRQLDIEYKDDTLDLLEEIGTRISYMDDELHKMRILYRRLKIRIERAHD